LQTTTNSQAAAKIFGLFSLQTISFWFLILVEKKIESWFVCGRGYGVENGWITNVQHYSINKNIDHEQIWVWEPITTLSCFWLEEMVRIELNFYIGN
jgi:hypothetical protein